MDFRAQGFPRISYGFLGRVAPRRHTARHVGKREQRSRHSPSMSDAEEEQTLEVLAASEEVLWKYWPWQKIFIWATNLLGHRF